MSARSRIVRVPASAANLGPGYDVLGAALAFELELEVAETGEFGIVSEGFEAPDRSQQPDRPRLRAACIRPTASPSGSAARSRSPAGSARAPRRSSPGCWPPTTCSSSPTTREDILARATEIEGHPDNVAAALYGGVTLCPPAAPGETAAGPGPARPARGRRGDPRHPARGGLDRGRPGRDARPSCRSPTSPTTSPPPPQLVLGIERSDLDLIARRPRRPRPPAPSGRALSALDGAGRAGCRARRARRDDLRRRADGSRLGVLAVGHGVCSSRARRVRRRLGRGPPRAVLAARRPGRDRLECAVPPAGAGLALASSAASCSSSAAERASNSGGGSWSAASACSRKPTPFSVRAISVTRRSSGSRSRSSSPSSSRRSTIPVMNDASQERRSPISRIDIVLPGGSRQIRTSCLGDRPKRWATVGMRGARPDPHPTSAITERHAAAAASSLRGSVRSSISSFILWLEHDICNT